MTTWEYVPTETLDPDYDNGTMVDNVRTLGEHVVGHRIVNVEAAEVVADRWGSRTYTSPGHKITLDNGKVVTLAPGGDCCAFTELEAFLLHADKIDHVITGVSTSDGYQTWHIFADAGDVLTLTVGWSAGNAFYYGYGFYINVIDADEATS